MNILVLGSGGREHAISWKIAQSDKCSKLFIAPGNPGTATLGEKVTNVALGVNDFEGIAKFVQENSIDMVVVGPEDPLVNGIHDYLLDEAKLDVKVIGPRKGGAKLEGSKDFSKQFMKRQNIPTAGYATFTKDTLEDGFAFLEESPDTARVFLSGENHQFKDFNELLEEKLDVQFKLVEKSYWHEMIDKIRNKQLDMFMAIVQTPKRNEYMNFTTPYIEFPTVIVTKDDIGYIRNLEQLSGKSIAVEQNYYTQELLQQYNEQIVLHKEVSFI